MARVRPQGPLPGDILLFTNATGVTKVIPWFTGSRYYHCAIYEGDGNVLEARPEGVVRRDIAAEEGNVFRVIPMPREGAERALHYARTCLGDNYDALEVAFIVLKHAFPRLNIHYSNRKSFICGEFVTTTWRRAGLDFFPGERAEEVIPAQFQGFLPPDARDMTLENGVVK